MSFRRYSIVSNNCFRSSSPGYIANYEEGIKQNVVQLEEKQRIISILTADRDASEEENTRLKDELAEVIEDREAHKKREEEQTKTIRKQNEELAILRTAKKKRFERITWWKRLGKFILLTIGYAVLFFLAVLMLNVLLSLLPPQMSESTRMVVDLAGIIGFMFTGIKKAWIKTYGKRKNKME